MTRHPATRARPRPEPPRSTGGWAAGSRRSPLSVRVSPDASAASHPDMQRLPFAVLAILSALALGSASPGPAAAEPSAVCSPLHPVASADVEVRIFGATWCGACAETERFLASIGATDSASVLVDGRRVSVRLRHLDVDAIPSSERASMRGDGIPEVQLVVRGQIVSWQAGAITSSAALDRFVDAGLESGGCVLSSGGSLRRPGRAH